MQSTIREVLRDKGTDVHTIAPDAVVARAVDEMNRYRIGCLVVTRGRQPVGIFTERDVLERIVATRRNPEHTWVVEVMTAGVNLVDASATVEHAMAIMTEHRCRHLPVMENRSLRGLISIGDLTKWCLDRERLRTLDLERYITS